MTNDKAVEDIGSSITDQSSSDQKEEAISTTQGSESYLQDQIQGEQEITSTMRPSHVRLLIIKFKFFLII